MTTTVALPLWLLSIVLAFAAWAAYDKLLMPALRWILANRGDSVIDEVGARLRIGIRPWQRTKRQALIHRLLTDPRVQKAAEDYATQKGVPVAVALQMIERYAREIVPAFNAYLYFRIGYWIGRRVAQGLYRVRLGYVDTRNLSRVDPNATVVFVMNHRSNMDYILAAYLAADQAALSYAVGEWARLWPLSALIRSMGAYFVRRNSRDELYRRVLERYIAMATEAGVPQAVFPEGGLSRDGLMREPRLGVIDYMLRGFHLDGERDLVYVPLGVNYDRVLEDRTLLMSIDPDARKPNRFWAIWNTLGFAVNNLRLMLKSDWHRFGYACVNFGSPVSMRAYCSERGVDFSKLAGEERKARVSELGRHLMDAVGRIVPVLPVPLMASVFARDPDKAYSELELKAEAGRILDSLDAARAVVYVPRRDFDYAMRVGLRMLLMRRLIEEQDGLYRAVARDLPVLRYYANSIAHLVNRSG
jgi:glycerol-3-phosphate O-acyltransferase